MKINYNFVLCSDIAVYIWDTVFKGWWPKNQHCFILSNSKDTGLSGIHFLRNLIPLCIWCENTTDVWYKNFEFSSSNCSITTKVIKKHPEKRVAFLLKKGLYMFQNIKDRILHFYERCCSLCQMINDGFPTDCLNNKIK